MNSKKKEVKLLRRPLPPDRPFHAQSPISLTEIVKDPSAENMPLYYSPAEVLSPVPSVVPSLASGFQESEILSKRLSTVRRNTNKLPSPIASYEKRFVLDSRYNLKTNVRTFTSPSHSLAPAREHKIRGPDPLPNREAKKYPEIRHEYVYGSENEPEKRLPEFTLHDFLLELPIETSSSPKRKNTLKKAIMSKQNYKKITTLFATFNKLPKQDIINSVQLKTDTIPKATPRIPQHQLLIEMAFILKQQMREMMNEDMQTLLPINADHAEALLELQDHPEKLNIFKKPFGRLFQDSARSSSPFTEMDPDSMITPSELAVLDSLVNGGLALSLKAHFIASLPDISPLYKTLTYLNLSFNEIRIMPEELFNLSELEVLKLRNNPIKEIPFKINQLKKLRTFVISFNLITSLPASLFQLPIEYLDVSYNKISYISNEIKNLRPTLRELNLEGNLLSALPCATLKLNKVQYLRVKNNYMHPLLWRDSSSNQPQRLTDMAALVVKKRNPKFGHTVEMPESLKIIIESYTACDCCQGPLYGSGLRLIRPCKQAFGIYNLPFYFVSCSPTCKANFMTQVDSLSEILYNDDV